MHFVGRTALHLARQIGDREFRRCLHEGVGVVARQHRAQDADFALVADLRADLAHPKMQLTDQHLGAVFVGRMR